MESRQEALDRIASIAREHGFSGAEILQALDHDIDPAAEASRKRSTHVLGKLLGPLGGIFVFAGLGVFIAMNWDAMNSLARIVITLGSGVSAFVLALVAAGDERGQRFTAPLYLIAAALQPIGLLVVFGEFSSGRDWHVAALATSLIMAIQQGLALRVKQDSVLLFTTMLFAIWALVTALDMMQVDEDFIAALLGASTVGLCAGLARTRYRGVTPFWYFAGSVSFFFGWFALLDGNIFELLFLLTACGGVYLSIVVKSRVLLFVSTVAILGYVSYFSAEHFSDSLGWPIVLILLGLMLIGLSAAAMRINRRYIARPSA